MDRALQSVDGARIAFASDRHGVGNEVYIMNADGSNVTRLTENPEEVGLPSVAWSPVP